MDGEKERASANEATRSKPQHAHDEEPEGEEVHDIYGSEIARKEGTAGVQGRERATRHP